MAATTGSHLKELLELKELRCRRLEMLIAEKEARLNVIRALKPASTCSKAVGDVDKLLRTIPAACEGRKRASRRGSQHDVRS